MHALHESYVCVQIQNEIMPCFKVNSQGGSSVFSGDNIKQSLFTPIEISVISGVEPKALDFVFL